ncbi:hypothetical protein IAG25_23100 [Caballeronia sp. EK]|uniref:hypothetical protein n=1 Tax=Caballeronia sp. EK TaxID=2767469 RepID=UPI001655095B|nr:hypothetical protein [Caballeronia sp. EK]MBC8639725.1 hypothetical protein [Caballeronia sp. EK]
MPVDLSEVGAFYRYPSHGPRILPWFGIWLVCCALGVPLMLLAWPASEPASGPSFWCAVIGVPNFAFLVLLCIARVNHEALWTYVHNRNRAREKGLAARLRVAQKPLQVLGVGYCVPALTSNLPDAVAAKKLLFRSQSPRDGVGQVVHNRFEEASWSEEPVLATDWEDDPDIQLHDHDPQAPRRVATIVLKLVQALEPLVPELQALSQYGPQYAPLVRVLAPPDEADKAAQHARDALRLAGLPALDCVAVSEAHGLMVADDWLDARERRALLVLAYAWHDAHPPERSSEAAVAVLLNAGFYQLPESVQALATLHRPIEDQPEADTLRDLALNAALWGKTEPRNITHAWITRLDADHDLTLLDELKKAAFTGIASHETRRRPDRFIGDTHAATPWLSIAAAIESGATSPHLILDRTQAAVLHVHQVPHDHPEQQPEVA